MTHRPLTWWEWLIADSDSIYRAGHDPVQRLQHTGHQRAMSRRWAQTIGMWGRAKPAAMINLYAPETKTAEEKRQARASYDLFKNRYHLRSQKQWMELYELHGDTAMFFKVSGVILATVAHARMAVWRKEMPNLTLGAMAREASSYEDPEAKRRDDTAYLGLLPIETLLYYHALEHILEETSVSHVAWAKTATGLGWFDLALLWKEHEGDTLVSLPPVALQTYPVNDA